MQSLRNRLLASHLVPSLIIFPLMTVAVLWLVETRLFWPMLTKELTDQVIILREIAHHSPELWQNATAAREFVQHFHPDPEDQLMLFDAAGHLLATTDSDYVPVIGQTLHLLDTAPPPGDAVQTHLRYSGEQKAEMVDVWTAVRDEQHQLLGTIHMTYHLATTYDQLRRFRLFVILITAIALLLRVATGLWLSVSLERPLTELTRAIEQLGAGKTATLPEWGVHELRIVARAFNGLTAQIHLLESTRQQLLANLIHEIRRPLGALNSAAYALLHGASEEPGLRTELLTGIHTELRRFHRLVDDLALLYSQTIGELELDRHPVDLATWLPAVLAPWRETAQQKGLTWQADLLTFLPTLNIDQDRLAQAIGNLLSNAVKFTPPGGIISLASGHNDDEYWLRVSDSGPGIAPQEQEHIFTRFYRSRTTQPFPQGMGLGLSIAQDLVAAHGGRITVESTLTHGSHFTLWLPLVHPPLSSTHSPSH